MLKDNTTTYLFYQMIGMKDLKKSSYHRQRGTRENETIVCQRLCSGQVKD